MTILDYVVLSILGISVLISMMRGAIHEIFSFSGWVLAFYVGKSYTQLLTPLLPTSIPTDSLKILAAFLILFLATLLVTSLIAIALVKLFEKAGLGWFDGLLGAFFGFGKGLIIVLVFVFLAGLTDFPKQDVWRNSMFSAPLEALVVKFLPWVPQSISSYIKYD